MASPESDERANPRWKRGPLDGKVSDETRLVVAVKHAPFSEDRKRRLAVQALRLDLTNCYRYVVIKDEKRQGAWKCAHQALKVVAGIEGATHAIVLDDDFLPCRDFLAAIHLHLKLLGPEASISYLTMRRVVREAKEKGVHWVRTPDALCGSAIVWSIEKIRSFLDFVRYTREEFDADDSKIACWHMAHNDLIWATAPCLLEHKDVTSLMGHTNDNKRVAPWFAGYETSALEFDWEKDVKNPLIGPRGMTAPNVYSNILKPGVAEEAGLSHVFKEVFQ